MALDNTGCVADIDPCEFGVYKQYVGTTVEAENTAMMECLANQANQASLCGKFDKTTATGFELTQIGEITGWPRKHCSVKPVEFWAYDCTTPPPEGTGCPTNSIIGICEPNSFYYCRLNGRIDYVFEDDELYRAFICAVIIKNRASCNKESPTVELIHEIITALWGEDAWVVDADCGVISVSAGRDLTEDEICILSLYRSVICAGPGIRIDIFCIAPPKILGCNRPPECIKTTIECNNP